MMACVERYEELLDHALSLAASAGLDAHLKRCAACTAALVEWRLRVEHLDTGVRQLVASEPSPYLGSRVLAEIHCATAPVGWTRRWRLAWVTLAFVAGITVMVHAVREAIERREQAVAVLAAAVALSNWRSPTEALLRSPADPLLKTLPRLGESFFELNPVVGTPIHEKGEKDAK